MQSSPSQGQPSRVVAEFGNKNNPSPVFLIERAESEEQNGSSLFVFRDADDDFGGTLATARLDHIDRKAKKADLDLEIDTHPAEFAYRLTVGDMKRGLNALMEASGVETVHVGGNASEESLMRMGCHATNNVVGFSLAKIESGKDAIAA